MTWKIDARQGNEGYKVRWEIIQWTRGRGLDLGCGPQKTFPHFIGVDNNIDAQLFGIPANPDIRVESAEDLSIFSSKSMDFVFSSHLLEHIKPEKVPDTLREWWRVMKEGAYLVLYLPDEDEYPKVGEEGANPDHKWNVSRERMIDYMRPIKGWDLVDFQKRNQEDEYSLYFVFKKIGDGQYFSHQNPKPLKTAALVRYGAFGDLLQSSSVIAGLKKQGYHVTLYCSPPGSDVMLHDPNIDAFYFQDKDQVPNHMLAEYWAYHRKKYDKWVNLCESVEGTFLALPGRSLHDWNPVARHRVMNVNYVEQQHLIGGVPYEPYVRFYSTLPEKEWARKERSKMGSKVLMWPLAGSSVHKTWPHLDQVIASIMVHYPEWDVLLVGGNTCQILEQGWEKEKRVHRRSGVWTIRQSMTFLDYADCIVGPETGVMNAASNLDTPKVVFLSHSSEENLTRDWVNCIPLWARNTNCPGRGNNEVPACHQMHYSWDFCKQAKGPDEKLTGVAQCQWDISMEQAWHAIEHAMNYKVEKAA